MSRREEDFMVLDDIGEDLVVEWLCNGNYPDFDLSDPVVRLGVITELRKHGFTVEPTGGSN